jgi:AcrR family transcriptional regulator
VGGADLVGAQRDDDGFDRVFVDLRWSAAAAFHPEDQLGRLLVRPRRHVLVLARRAGATSPDSGLSTDRCGHCLAPLADSDAVACGHCGVDLTSGDHDWVLEEVVPYDLWRLRRSAAEGAGTGDPFFVTPTERRRVLQLLAAMARADGEVEESERRLLKGCARRWAVPWHEVEVLLDSATGPQLEGLEGFDGTMRRALFDELERVLRADGRLDRKEQLLLETVRARWTGTGATG